MPSILRSTLSTPPPPSHQLIRSMSTLMPVYHSCYFKVTALAIASTTTSTPSTTSYSAWHPLLLVFLPKVKSKTSKSHIRQSRSLMISRREGRGGKGRTAGRGRKGWKARHPNSSRLPGFAGGQTPITKAFPKLGIQKKKGRVRDGIFLLATGGQFLKTKIDIEVTRASVGAIQVVERNGGTVTTAYHNKEIIRAALYPEKYLQVRQLLVPANPQEIARYVDPERRGYLAPLVDGLDKKDIMQRILKEVKTLKKLNKVV
ncbi:hypothetical protein BSLG_009365 [Batrachochytrium salamandrivorans]|nr:hypothetical protein BSLG_009365 [Batrachochytrium salamandrivorans]